MEDDQLLFCLTVSVRPRLRSKSRSKQVKLIVILRSSGTSDPRFVLLDKPAQCQASLSSLLPVVAFPHYSLHRVVWHGRHVALISLPLQSGMVNMLLSYACHYGLAWSTCCSHIHASIVWHCSHVHDTNSSIVNNLSFVFKLSMSNSLTLHKENVIIFKLFLYNLSISIVEMKYRNISVNKIKVVSRFAMSLH